MLINTRDQCHFKRLQIPSKRCAGSAVDEQGHPTSWPRPRPVFLVIIFINYPIFLITIDNQEY
jgi:hypothetical protein